MHTVVLSPHLDDAVLSVGCCIAEEVDRGNEVTVVTVFSDCGDNTDAAKEYAIRRREDETAVGSLGAATEHWDLTDAPFRGGYYTTFERIVCGWREVEDELVALVRERVDRVHADRILAPLAVGEHVDHRVVFAAARRSTRSIEFYEDLPYAFVSDATRLRLARLGFRVAGEPPPDPARFTDSFRAAGYVRSFLPPAERDTMLHRMQDACRAAQDQWDLLPSTRPALFQCTADALGRQLSAVDAYRSQLPDLFPHCRVAEAYDSHYAEKPDNDGYAVRLWRLDRSKPGHWLRGPT